jgi:exodeoxyribonuclease VII small subunit
VSGQEREHRSEERARSGAVRGSEPGTPSEQTDEPTTTYEQAREELADVVRRLEAGGLTLEESLALWERGEELATLCQHWLDRARERLAAASPADDGNRPPG